ncbi:MAG: hypothetical protein KA004_13385 [Verrucomicrobiales bacterium]|nr:hypothetical protein [Verrucomicrobiales bacterium]
MNPNESIENSLRTLRLKHPSEEDLMAVLDGTATPTTKAVVESHLALCLVCERKAEILRETMDSFEAAVAKHLGTAAPARPAPPPNVIPLRFGPVTIGASTTQAFAAASSASEKPFPAIMLDTGDHRLKAKLRRAQGGLVIEFWSDDATLIGAEIEFEFAGRIDSVTLKRHKSGSSTSNVLFPVTLSDEKATAAASTFEVRRIRAALE